MFRFFSYGLEKHFRADVFRDFEQLVRKDFSEGWHLFSLL